MIDYADETDEVVHGPRGVWTRTTPPDGTGKPRTYTTTHTPDVTYTSMTAMLASVLPDAGYGNVDPELLAAASTRGTACHDYLEQRLVTGIPVDLAVLRGDHDALDYLPAIEAFLDDEQPTVDHPEIVCFDPAGPVAGTVDAPAMRTNTWGVFDADFKTRGGEEHRRFPKEAAQLGGYSVALSEGFWFDRAGTLMAPTPALDQGAVITFCADGTYAVHVLDLDAARRFYRDARAVHTARMAIAEACSVPRYFGGIAYGQPADPAVHFQRRLDKLPAETRSQLAKLWTGHDLPRIADLTLEHWATAAALFCQFDGTFGHVAPRPMATTEQMDDLARRIKALPADLAAQVQAATRHVVGPERYAMRLDDIADYERVLVPAEEAARTRQAEIVTHGLAQFGSVLGDHAWTDTDLDRAHELKEAADAGIITRVDGAWQMRPGPEPWDLGLPKRDATALAKRVAVEIGRPKPAKHADIFTDVVLLAAVVAA